MHYVIGDIHANARELRALLDTLDLRNGDRLIFVGDYLDKGDQPKETLALLADLCERYPCTFLRGNHEFVWDRYLNHGELERRDFLLNYGGLETLRPFVNEAPEALIAADRVDVIRPALQPYLDLIAKTETHALIEPFFITHGGLLPEQLSDESPEIGEVQLFLRPGKMDTTRRHLGRRVVIGGHTHVPEAEMFSEGYINIDLGAAYGKRLGAFCLERRCVIRSDGAEFPYPHQV